MLLFIEYDDAKIEIILVIIIITIKNCQLTVVIPATKQSISSGKKGNKNIQVKTNLSFPLIVFNPFFNSSSPTNHFATLKPKSLPIKKARIEPKIIPIQLNIEPLSGPNNSTPAPTVIKAGIGRTTTCKNCIKINKKIAFPMKEMNMKNEQMK